MEVHDVTELGGADIRATCYRPSGGTAMRQWRLELLQRAILTRGGGQWGGVDKEASCGAPGVTPPMENGQIAQWRASLADCPGRYRDRQTTKTPVHRLEGGGQLTLGGPPATPDKGSGVGQGLDYGDPGREPVYERWLGGVLGKHLVSESRQELPGPNATPWQRAGCRASD